MNSGLRWKLIVAFLLVFFAGLACGFFGALHSARWMIGHHRGGSVAEHMKQRLHWQLARLLLGADPGAASRTPAGHLSFHYRLHPGLHELLHPPQECGFGAEWVRAPRLPLEGREREDILRIIYKGIETKPKLTD